MNRDGVSLVELLISLTLLVFGLLAVAGIMVGAAQSIALARALDRSAMEIESLLDSARWDGLSGAGDLDRGGGRMMWQLGSQIGDQGWVRYEHPVLPQPVTVHFIRGWGP